MTVAEIMEAVKELKVMELSELVKALEEEFGVSATPVAVAGGAAAGGHPHGDGGLPHFLLSLRKRPDERRYLPAGRGLRPAGGGWVPAGTGQLPAAEGAASGTVGLSFGGSLVWSLVKGSEI